MAMEMGGEGDVFDRVYLRWAEHARGRGSQPPSRERWDAIVLRLILSRDPARIARYKYLEGQGEESLGADAFELWSKTPAYTPNLSVNIKEREALRAYAESKHGSMKRLMEGQGLGERYEQILADYEVYLAARKARARKGQQQVMIIGCAGMGAIVVMMLTVLLIIVLQMAR
jgi:hypothetical protein